MSENINGTILIKRTFSVWEFLGCSLVLLWFVLGLLQGREKKGKKNRNLNNRTFLPLSRSSIQGNYTSHTGGRGGSPCPYWRDG